MGWSWQRKAKGSSSAEPRVPNTLGDALCPMHLATYATWYPARVPVGDFRDGNLENLEYVTGAVLVIKGKPNESNEEIHYEFFWDIKDVVGFLEVVHQMNAFALKVQRVQNGLGDSE